MIRLFAIVAVFVCASISATAQYELSLQASYELPLDELRWVFKPGTGAIAIFSKTKTYKKKRSAFGIGVGYSRFVPKEKTFYYLVSQNEVGTISYENMNVYQLTGHLRRDIIIKKIYELFYGVECGYYYTQYGFVSQDPFHSINSSNFIGRIALAGKAGIGYPLSKNIGAFFQTRYLISMSPSNDGENTFNAYWANSLGVNLRF